MTTILPEREGVYSIESIDSWMKILNESGSRSVLPFRFTTVEAIDNRPAKSGAVIYRQLKRLFFDGDLGVACQSLDNLKKNKLINTLIIFDDVIGTGEQFILFIEKYKIYQLNYNVLYCPLAAHEDGILRIAERYPNIDVIPIENLTDMHGLFSKNNNMFNIDGISYSVDYSALLRGICESRKFKIPSNEYLGKGDLALTYLFKDSTPNNNISAIWYGSETWTKLAKR